MNKFLLMLLAGLLLVPSLTMAAPSIEELQKQIAEIAEELADMEDRIEGPERHTALDRINWYGDFRTKVDSLHYQDVTWNPGILADFDAFATKVGTDPEYTAALTDAGGNNIILNAPSEATIRANTYNPLTDPNASPYDRAYAVMYGMTFQQVFAANGGDAVAADLAAHGFASILNPTSQMLVQYPDVAAGFGLGLLSGVTPFPMAEGPSTTDINNDLFYTTRLRLGMKAKIYKNMSFAGRLTMFKNWGDSVGTNVFDSWNAFTMDGTGSGSPSGDWLRVERAYFNWSNIADTPFYLSIGRRPSTYGSPANYRENELRGGTPGGHMVNFNFDGITLGYKAEDLLGLEGASIRFCYGQGFESEWGNGELFNDSSTANIKDTHLGGFNIDAFNNGDTLVQLTLFRAMDVNDGFKGTFAFPTVYANLFAPTMSQDMQKFPTFNFVTRYTPSTVIGDINLVGLNVSHTMENDLVLFGSVAMTQLESNGEAGMFGGMGSDAIFTPELVRDAQGNSTGEIYFTPDRAENDDANEGYGVYVGMQMPAPMGKFGIEYNYGSEYWTPFTQAQDDALGSKLATRGHAGEAYYIFEINRNAFIKVGGIYYDYEYTGSGSPVGKPQKIEDIEDGTAYSLTPAVDTAWDAYASMTMKW